MKQCTKCKEMKSIEDFGKRKRNNDGYDTTCKQCRKEYYEQTIINNHINHLVFK